MVATTVVTPLGRPGPVGELLAVHEAAGIEFRLMANLWPGLDEIAGSTLRFSAIRMRNAQTRT
jgi:hypothetical protein